MLRIQQIIDAAIAQDDSLQIKTIPGPGLNPAPLAKKAGTLPSTELLRNAVTRLTRQLQAVMQL